MTLNILEMEIAKILKHNARETILESLVDAVAEKGWISGYDKHSLGAIVATPEQIRDYGFHDFPRYPGSEMFSEPVSLYDPKIRPILRELRSREGISLIEMTDNPKIVQNGIILPFSNTNDSVDNILKSYGAKDTAELAYHLKLSENMGGKTLALLDMSAQYPDVLIVRVDGSKYALKDKEIYHLDKREKKEYMQIVNPYYIPTVA